MNIHSVEGGSPSKRPETSGVDSSEKLSHSNFFSKVKDVIFGEAVAAERIENEPPVVFSEEDVQKILECFKELFPLEECATIDEGLAKIHVLFEEIRNNREASGTEEKIAAIAKTVQTICQIGIKSPSSNEITIKGKRVVTKGVSVVSCIRDLSTTLKSICDYVKDVNPLVSSMGLSNSSSSFVSLLAAVEDFKKLLEAYNIGNRDEMIQASLAVVMDLDRSAVGFSFFIEEFARVAVAAGNTPAANLAASSAAVGTDLFGGFYVLMGLKGITRLSNLAWHSEKLGVGLWKPKDLEALKFFKEKMEITPLKVFNELKTKYGKNLNELLRKEARLQAKTLYWSIQNEGKAPSIGDFVEWGRDLLGLKPLEERELLEKFSLNMAKASEKGNREKFKGLIDLSKFNAEYPQLAELDPEELQGLSIVCCHMEARANKQLSRIAGDKDVSKVQDYVDGLLKKRKDFRETPLTQDEMQEAKKISKELRAGYWQKVRSSAGLVAMGGLGLCVVMLSGMFAPVVLISCVAVLSLVKAYGYDYDKLKLAVFTKDPLKPYDKTSGWANLGLGLLSAAVCGALVGASIASFGIFPVAVAGVVLTVWIVSSCYDLNNLYLRERFWNENEQIWQGQTIDGQLVRVDVLPASLGGRVHNVTHDEFSSRTEKIALHKIKESFVSNDKKKELIKNFKDNNSVFQIEKEKNVTKEDLAKASEWFREIQKIIEEEESRLKKIFSENADAPMAPIVVDSISETLTSGLSSIDGSSVLDVKVEEAEKTLISRTSFPVSRELTDLQKKIEKVKGHIKYLENKRLGTKSSGAGRQKRVSLSEQIAVHQKRLEKLESEKKSS